MRSMTITVAAMMALICSPVLSQELDTRHYIYIEDSATASLPAEYATIAATAFSKGPTPEAAVEANNKTMGGLVALLDKDGVVPSDIETGAFGFEAVYIKPTTANAYEQPDPDRDKFGGYRVTNSFRAKVRDLARIGEILGAISKQGVTIDKLTFGTSKQAAAEESTREQAVANALERAQRMAAAGHMKLGEMLQMREGTGYNPETLEAYPPGGEADLMAAPVSGVVPAAIVVTNSISAKWEVLPAEK
jgi:uncharacterized protein